jgi:hypothetical protein
MPSLVCFLALLRSCIGNSLPRTLDTTSLATIPRPPFQRTMLPSGNDLHWNESTHEIPGTSSAHLIVLIRSKHLIQQFRDRETQKDVRLLFNKLPTRPSNMNVIRFHAIRSCEFLRVIYHRWWAALVFGSRLRLDLQPVAFNAFNAFNVVPCLTRPAPHQTSQACPLPSSRQCHRSDGSCRSSSCPSLHRHQQRR